MDTSGKLYVDGIDANKTISTTGTDRSFIGAKWTAPNATNYFSGWIEEVRIWNGNISQDQIKFLMNQRLQNGANIGSGNSNAGTGTWLWRLSWILSITGRSYKNFKWRLHN